eukprot:6111035-Pleurochrysis_carterae.AAC.2
MGEVSGEASETALRMCCNVLRMCCECAAKPSAAKAVWSSLEQGFEMEGTATKPLMTRRALICASAVLRRVARWGRRRSRASSITWR